MDYVDLSEKSRDHTILELRDFSRKLVRELGFMRNTLADSDLAPSAVHAVIEIGLAPGLQARDLADTLRLDKSNTSRQLAKLESLGLVTRETASDDARSSRLFLTAAGKKLRQKIDRFATDQVSNALRRLVPAEQQTLVRSLALYADALAQDNVNKTPRAAVSIDEKILESYQPGCIGDIASLHARFYSQAASFGVFFEKKVATELAEFAMTLPSAGKALWLYVENGRSLASIAIDADHVNDRLAHLRWFIVDESLRGSGVGRRLLSKALDFVDREFDETYLWTFKSLDAARHLYESSGFQLTEEAEGSQWGTHVIEQKFNRRSERTSW
ncbi:bifunctional helix-turn-helix transcriptional regulator/GNAT family N-acetyltransferase [Caballeronia sordidicola]|jgi:DNA-binding MarR family transcriptional regulator/GNAT superfamily N-acetyltransferase|uniref:Transcriptional regulator, MarR family / Acetyltransferase (GNAT) n=1 Tax=Caballeronia sordidicola TaxID=196367 RepID=A0A226WVJ6_CABSO|nr:helix-turn-helix domain-containing GNAT family N-acetyltransferase [Caballeronia sordidicola]OXC75204.1 Transcriptional regulator, MarR family / Acetyltransferase (GNAT) [Caballeronia sordidicola]